MKHNPQKEIEKQKIQKQQLKLEKQLLKRIETTKKLYQKNFENKLNKIKEQNEKKLQRRLNQINKQYNQRKINKKKEIKWQKIVKKSVKEKSWKKKAFEAIQYLSKIARADWDWLVLQRDTMKVVHWAECQWWHIFPKKNYPHMAFLLDNIWPISQWWNYKQLDNIWYERWFNTWIGMKRLAELEEMSKDKLAKNRIITEFDYMWYYQKAVDMINIEEKRLWIKSKYTYK